MFLPIFANSNLPEWFLTQFISLVGVALQYLVFVNLKRVCNAFILVKILTGWDLWAHVKKFGYWSPSVLAEGHILSVYSGLFCYFWSFFFAFNGIHIVRASLCVEFGRVRHCITSNVLSIDVEFQLFSLWEPQMCIIFSYFYTIKSLLN